MQELSRVKLTDATAQRATLPDGRVDAVIWDAEVGGFGLRLRPGGKTWVVAYRPAGTGRSGQFKRMKLGSFPTLPTKEARTLARVTLGKVAAGDDPLRQRRVSKTRVQTKLGEVIGRYDTHLEQRGYVNRLTVVSGLKSKLGRLLNRDIAEVSGADVMAALDGPGGASFRPRVKAFFSWAVSTARLIDESPIAGQRKQRSTRQDKIATAEHGRALSDDELMRIWASAEWSTSFGRFIRFLILTGCRRGEGSGLTRQMIDLERQIINLPANFTKQGRAHAVPACRQLREMIDGAPQYAGTDLVFPSARSGGEMSGWTKLVAGLRAKSGVNFDLHDLRRTFRTGLSRLGVEPEIAELAMGHAREDLEGRYNRDDRAEKVRDAFERWARHVLRLITEKAVRNTAAEPLRDPSVEAKPWFQM